VNYPWPSIGLRTGPYKTCNGAQWRWCTSKSAEKLPKTR